MFTPLPPTVAFRIYDMDKDGYISNGELFQVLKMMVGNNLKETQLQQIVDKTILLYDKVLSLLFSSIVPLLSFPQSLKIYVNRTILLYDKLAGRNLSS